MRTRNVAAIVVVFVLTGCSEILADFVFYTPDAALHGPDAGADAGPSIDAGDVDAGSDAGEDEVDAGGDEVDAGVDPCTGGTGLPVQLATGTFHACAVVSGCRAYCWGGNASGQLGYSSTQSCSGAPCSLSSRVIPGLVGVLEVAPGRDHTCARMVDGTVRCWGADASGQLANSSVAIPIAGMDNVTQVASGSAHSCALLLDTTVTCWGMNNVGQLGSATTETCGGFACSRTPTEVPGLVGVTEVTAGGDRTCVRMNDDTVRCWGRDGDALGGSTPEASVSGLDDTAHVTVGGSHVCARLRNGTVQCWGSNSSGQLDGTGLSSDSAIPGAVPGLTNIAGVDAGVSANCSWLIDGTVRCWGSSGFGQLGGSSTSTPIPGLTAVQEVSMGTSFACARSSDGSVYCWGHNANGQLGNGAVDDIPDPTLVIGWE